MIKFLSLYLLILSHVLADYLFQSQKMADNKASNWRVCLGHGVIVVFVAFLLTLPFLSLRWLIGLLILFLGHFFVDYGKGRIRNMFKNSNFELGIIDQIVHLLVILFIWMLFNPSGGDRLFFRGLYDWLCALPQGVVHKCVLYLAAYIFILKGGTDFVKGLLSKISFREKDVSDEELKVGRIIGNLERVLIMTFVLLHQFAAVGLVIAAKSIARFRELEDRNFAEYYLVGTLASTLIAVVVGLAVSLA